MRIGEKEYGFRYTVGAEEEIARLCPGEDLRRIAELLRDMTPTGVRARAELLCVLSRWDEKARHFENSEHVEQPLTMELLALQPKAVFVELQNEAFAAIKADSQPSVEAEPEKKDAAPI